MNRAFCVALLAGVVCTNDALGQEHPRGAQAPAAPMMQMMEMGEGMMALHAGLAGPAMLLGAAEVLGLSDDQEERLESLAERERQEHEQHAHAAMQAHHSAAEAIEGDSPDLEAYAAALREASSHMVLAHVAAARAAVDARAVLTTAQRERLTDALGVLRGLHSGMHERSPR